MLGVDLGEVLHMLRQAVWKLPTCGQVVAVATARKADTVDEFSSLRPPSIVRQEKTPPS